MFPQVQMVVAEVESVTPALPILHCPVKLISFPVLKVVHVVAGLQAMETLPEVEPSRVRFPAPTPAPPSTSDPVPVLSLTPGSGLTAVPLAA
jgi:hypothetical protein